MAKKKIVKETLLTAIVDNYTDEEILKADGLDEAVIGVEENSMKECIRIFRKEGMSEEEALDHFYYNVQGSYVGEKTPIWCNDTMG
jgi:hypothetical protein